MYLFFPLLKQISQPNALGQCLKYLLLKRFYKYFEVCALISWSQIQAGQKCRRQCLGWSLSPAKKSFMGPLVLLAAPKTEIPTLQGSRTGHGICVPGDLFGCGITVVSGKGCGDAKPGWMFYSFNTLDVCVSLQKTTKIVNNYTQKSGNSQPLPCKGQECHHLCQKSCQLRRKIPPAEQWMQHEIKPSIYSHFCESPL